MQTIRRHPGRRGASALRRAVGVLAAAMLGLVGVLAFGMAPSAATPDSWPQTFNPEPGHNTYDTADDLNVECPNGIAGTPGSDPADKVLNSALNTDASFTPGGTVHYIFNDNPNNADDDFTLQDCVVAYPVGYFDDADVDASGAVIDVSKNELDKNGTQIDGAALSGVLDSTGEIFYSWTAPATLTAGQWVCNFARDIDTGHGGGGNRKVTPTCYKVIAPVTPAVPTHIESTECDVLDSYTIPSTTGVTYKVNGVTKAAGTYDLPAGVEVDVTAEADDGYFIADGAETSWSFTGSEVQACSTTRTPTAPTHTVNEACAVVDTYTIPSMTGVVYKVNDVVTAAGTHDLPAGTTVVITAEAGEGFEIAEGATTSWSFTGSDVPECGRPVTPTAPTHTVNEACAVVDTYTIPSTAGVLYQVGGVPAAAATYTLPAGTTVNITAVAAEGAVLDEQATTSWSFTGSAVPTCPTTQGGGDPTPTTTTVAPTTTTTAPELAFTGEPAVVETTVAPTTTTVPAGPELPFTGSETAAMTAAGLLALVLGGLCLVASKRTRRA
jgi:hypothetical protein